MPVRLDWLIVRLVGDVALIETFPLATVPPVGSDCANDGCAQPRPHKSATKLTEARSSLADGRPDVDETINRTTIRFRSRHDELPASTNSLSDLQWFDAGRQSSMKLSKDVSINNFNLSEN